LREGVSRLVLRMGLAKEETRARVMTLSVVNKKKWRAALRK
jgi:hypothetical protein